MNIREMINEYMAAVGNLATITQEPEGWTLETTEDTTTGLTDQELIEIMSETISRNIYLITRDEYETLYNADVDGEKIDYSAEVDRFDNSMTDREKAMLQMYCQEAQDLITSDREAAAFIRACDLMKGPGIEYAGHLFELINGEMVIDHKPVKVIESKSHTYKINKRSISAQGGAPGLYRFIEELAQMDFGRVWVKAIADGAAAL